jgi:hypothetical protein
MAAGKGRQSYLSSLGLKEHTFTALWGLPCPEGPFCLRVPKGTERPLGANTLISQEPVVNFDELERRAQQHGTAASGSGDSQQELI